GLHGQHRRSPARRHRRDRRRAGEGRLRQEAPVAPGPLDVVGWARAAPQAHRLGGVRRRAAPRLQAPDHDHPRQQRPTRVRERRQGRCAHCPRGCARQNRGQPPMTDSNDTRPISHVFRWDLDKTYLQTEFDKVADLIRTALQKPEEKRNVPGAVALLRALLREPLDGSRRAVYFISGSPRQMRKTLERKLELDGIHPDAFVLKPNLQNLLLFRFKAIRGQVGYKLRALLEHQAPGSAAAPETLFGDDAEQDAFIYSIYGEIVSGRLPL